MFQVFQHDSALYIRIFVICIYVLLVSVVLPRLCIVVLIISEYIFICYAVVLKLLQKNILTDVVVISEQYGRAVPPRM